MPSRAIWTASLSARRRCRSTGSLPQTEKRVDECSSARYVGGMSTGGDFEIFLATAPGLESVLCAEAKEKRFKQPTVVQGGVTVQGGWPEVWRANLEIRGASRILARIAEFRAMHLAQ